MKPLFRQPSSRELRRAKRRDMTPPPPVPMFIRMQNVLAPLERIIDDIERTGDVTALNGTPVFDLPHESGRQYHTMAPAIDGIADFYEMFWARRKQHKVLAGIRQLAKRLHYSMPITEHEIAAAKDDMAAMRAIVPMLTESEATDLILQTQIKAEIDARGKG
ncbi:MAG: hypothetical protein GX086_05910 [Alcaligenaceae bacterium]|nr:hypothetical protein [Alcaligenaceae bacterium]